MARTKTIRDRQPQKKRISVQPEHIGYVEDARYGALIALGVSGHPHAVMFDPDTNEGLVKFIRSFGTIEQDGTLHETQWIARWTAISDNEATLLDIARVGRGPADYALLNRDERHKWYVQAIHIMHDYGVTTAPAMASVLAWSLNCDLNDHMRRGETLQDANYRLHFQCSKVRDERGQKAEKRLAAHAPAGCESSDNLSDWFPREDKPMSEYPDWIDKPDAARFAIPNHMKRELNIPSGLVGEHVRKCFGMPLDVFLNQHGAKVAYDRCVEYCDTFNNNVVSEHETANEAPADATEGEQLARLVDQEKEMQLPESPVVVFPQGNGSVNYKGIKFSVTLRIGGTFDMAVPLMDEYVTAFAKEIIDIDRSCLVSQPAAQQTKPAQSAVAPAQQTAQSNGNGMKYEQIARVQCDVVNGATKYALWGANPKLQWALFTLETSKSSHAEHINQLLNALNAQGIGGLTGGVSVNVNLKVYWTPSQNLKKSGQPYQDIVQIVSDAPEKSEVPF